MEALLWIQCNISHIHAQRTQVVQALFLLLVLIIKVNAHFINQQLCPTAVLNTFIQPC